MRRSFAKQAPNKEPHLIHSTQELFGSALSPDEMIRGDAARAGSISAVRTKARSQSAQPSRIFAQTDLRNRTDGLVADLPDGALCGYALGTAWWDQEQGKSYSNDRSSSF
jgi:hypothetical protein